MSKLVRFACGAIFLVSIAASLASNAGLCFEKKRLLNDNDYFNGAIDVVINDPVDGVVEYFPGGSVAKPVHSQKYSSPKEFLNENPLCCRFVSPNSGDGGPEVSILDRILGIRIVEVSYVKRYFDEDRQKTSKTITKVAVTNCGKGHSYR